MKLKLLTLSLFLLTGCSTNYSKYQEMCDNIPESFMNDGLKSQYYKERSFYTNSLLKNNFTYLKVLEQSKRWTSIEVYLFKIDEYFPPKDALYRVYKDYSLKECIKEYSPYIENLFNEENNNFCIAAKNIDIPVSNIQMIYQYEDKTRNTGETEYKIFVNKELFIQKKYYSFFSPTTMRNCYKKDQANEIIFKDFR